MQDLLTAELKQLNDLARRNMQEGNTHRALEILRTAQELINDKSSTAANSPGLQKTEELISQMVELAKEIERAEK